MNPPSEDMKDLADGESALGLTFATDLFISKMPSSPDQCVCMFDTGGFDPLADVDMEKPTVQIRIRGERGNYKVAHELAQALRDFFKDTSEETVNGARYTGIWIMGDVMFLGYDENDRPELTVNLRMHRTPAS